MVADQALIALLTSSTAKWTSRRPGSGGTSKATSRRPGRPPARTERHRRPSSSPRHSRSPARPGAAASAGALLAAGRSRSVRSAYGLSSSSSIWPLPPPPGWRRATGKIAGPGDPDVSPGLIYASGSLLCFGAIRAQGARIDLSVGLRWRPRPRPRRFGRLALGDELHVAGGFLANTGCGSRPMPTFSPGQNFVPRWRTRMLPASTASPPELLHAEALAGRESRPLREEPPDFLCAMAVARSLPSSYALTGSALAARRGPADRRAGLGPESALDCFGALADLAASLKRSAPWRPARPSSPGASWPWAFQAGWRLSWPPAALAFGAALASVALLPRPPTFGGVGLLRPRGRFTRAALRSCLAAASTTVSTSTPLRRSAPSPGARGGSGCGRADAARPAG